MNMKADGDLRQFIEDEILPRYKSFGRSHGLEHVRRVIANSLELATGLNDGTIPNSSAPVDLDMVYVIAAYHDLGMIGPRETHEIAGGKILSEDERLRKWFTASQIQTMKEAVEDHRASADHAPRSIYGAIVAEADRDLEPEVVFTRAIEYGLEHYPELDEEGQWQRFARHMDEKYGPEGYLKLWIPGSPNERHLRELHSIITDRPRLRKIFDDIFITKKPGD